MEELNAFTEEKRLRIEAYDRDLNFKEVGKRFFTHACLNKYTYNFTWMGLPVIQFPQDLVVMQELLYELKPDLVIETGIAHGGSLVFYASMMELMGKGRVIGIDIDIRSHNRKALSEHEMAHRVILIEGSSTSHETVDKVSSLITPEDKVVLVCLDSKHTHDHVLVELNAFSKFVTLGSYIVVFDTTAQILDESALTILAENYQFKPWGKDSNPHSALKSFLSQNVDFEIDHQRHLKCQITNCYEGFLRRIGNSSPGPGLSD
jgi:cephalosporin hydroxylase